MINAAQAGANVLMRYFGTGIGFAHKENRSNIVSQADIESEQTILRLLQNEYPGNNYIADESGYIVNGSDYTWTIDPLDGLPCADTMYFSQKGRGAFRNDEPVRVSGETKLENILCSYCMDYHPDPKVTRSQGLAFGRLASHVRNIRATNCLVDFCYVIDGRFGACINQATMIWDIAPGLLILEEAGGVLTDLSGTRIVLDIDKSRYLKNYPVIAAGKSVFPELLKLFQNPADV